MTTLIAKMDASSRTKNRLSEHKMVHLIENKQSVTCLDHRPGLLIECDECEWIGWIPSDEVRIIY